MKKKNGFMIFEKDFSEKTQEQPGLEHKLKNKPIHSKFESDKGLEEYRGNRLLQDKVAVITGGDSGIGKAVAIQMAKEGAKIAIICLEEEKVDAEETKKSVDKETECSYYFVDIGYEKNCENVIDRIVKKFVKIDILVNNAAEQHLTGSIEDITEENLERTFRTNILSMFYMSKCALRYMKEGSCIINSTSVTGYKGKEALLGYSSTKGEIAAFTRSLSQNLASKNIRVNGVAPGPIWTPLILATFTEEMDEEFGKSTPMRRAGQPSEVASCYVFLASNNASYMTGQILHPNGSTIVNA